MKFKEMTDEDAKGMREQIIILNTLASMLIKMHSQRTGITYTREVKDDAFGAWAPVYNINCSHGRIYPLELMELHVDLLSTRHNNLLDPEWPEDQECSGDDWDEKTRDPKYFQIKMGAILKNMLLNIDMVNKIDATDPSEFLKQLSKKLPHHRLKMKLDKSGKLVYLQGILTSELQRRKEKKEEEKGE